MTHPAVQVVAATGVIAALPTNWGLWLAVPGAIYYAILIAQQAANAPTTTVGALWAKVQSIWQRDKPYLVFAAMVGFAVCQYLNISIPAWAMTLAAGLGIATLHSYSKGTKAP